MRPPDPIYTWHRQAIERHKPDRHARRAVVWYAVGALIALAALVATVREAMLIFHH